MDQVIQVVAVALYHEGKYLVARRGPGQIGEGLWEFPGGKVDPGESDLQALHREILEELGIRIKNPHFVGENLHHYPHRSIQLRLYRAMPLDLKIQLVDHDQIRWLSTEEMLGIKLSEADRPFVQILSQMS